MLTDGNSKERAGRHSASQPSSRSAKSNETKLYSDKTANAAWSAQRITAFAKAGRTKRSDAIQIQDGECESVSSDQAYTRTKNR
jgi:hypothetical protein